VSVEDAGSELTTGNWKRKGRKPNKGELKKRRHPLRTLRKGTNAAKNADKEKRRGKTHRGSGTEKNIGIDEGTDCFL